jgi:quinoprotein glucose dehydrogenase
VAYDQASGLAVMNATNIVTFIKLIPRNEYDDAHRADGFQHFDVDGVPYVIERGRLYSPLGFGVRHAPCNPPPWGQLTAIDLNTGKTRWQIPFGKIAVLGPIKSLEHWGSPNQGGPIITRGGLVFIGASPDNLLRAFDLYTGEQVWAGDLPAPAIATPMTYAHGADHRQFVVVAAGGRQDFETDISDAIVAFALRNAD